jgi:hypothetical protein
MLDANHMTRRVVSFCYSLPNELGQDVGCWHWLENLCTETTWAAILG